MGPETPGLADDRRRVTAPRWQARFREVWMAGKDGHGLAGMRRPATRSTRSLRDLDQLAPEVGKDPIGRILPACG